jgi:hypothetical protein
VNSEPAAADRPIDVESGIGGWLLLLPASWIPRYVIC